jgi:quinol monooxygenase YgiN
MILATIRMVIVPARRAEALEILNLAAERTRVQPGCLSCRIYHDEQIEAVFMVEEIWKCQEDLDRHLQSDDYRNVLFVTEMAVEPPEITFRVISQSAGVEIIEKGRGCSKG